MKISELKNAPEWLVLADTKNADVEITSYGLVIWKSGNFLGGNFLGGIIMPHCRWVYGVSADGRISIGCETRTIEEWDEFFSESCTEQLSTPRDSVSFKKIRASYEATKAYLKIINPSETVMIIGYGRVSTEDQDLTRQIEALQKAGCERIYLEKISGSKSSRPELDKMQSELQSGDVVVVQTLDRLGRSLINLLDITEAWEKKGIGFKCINQNFDTTTSAGKLFFSIVAAFAEFERNIIRERTKDALRVKRDKGVKLGRKADKDKEQQTKTEIADLLASGMSEMEIRERLKIGRSTYYKYKKI